MAAAAAAAAGGRGGAELQEQDAALRGALVRASQAWAVAVGPVEARRRHP
jgi:hypothetical protein